jgi:conjugal transfer pilus assembly protein TraW
MHYGDLQGMKRRFLILALLFFCFPGTTTAVAALHDLGTFGATYPVVEKDAIEEIKEKASKTDWRKHFDKKKIDEAVKGYRPDHIARLPRATQDRTFRVDMTYTIDFDVTDGKGGIVYPKGYTFNPLDYIEFPNVLVVIDASDKEQVTWLRSSEYVKDYRTMLFITDGGFWDLSHYLKRPVFYAARKIVDRLRLKAVPSVIRQSGRYMEINEIAIKSQDNKDESDSGLSPVSVSAD